MYRDFYGFTRCPFQLSPEPAGYFESLSQRQAIACLNRALGQGEGFVVVTGDVGVGKSALVGQFLATIEQPLLTVAVIDGHFDGGTIIPAVARAFGRSARNGDFTDRDDVEPLLQAEARSGCRCLLVVDDAHNLSVGALQALCRLSAVRAGGQALLQVLLVGMPELRNRLNDYPELEPLRQRVIASHRLDPLEAGEVEHYIRHRLTCVGWSGNPGFAPRIFVEIHAATGGVPARINQIANLLLLAAAAGRKEHIDGAMLAQVLGESIAFPLPAKRSGSSVKSRAIELNDPFPSALENALARCESRIAELQQVVADLAGAGGGQGRNGSARDHGALEERLGGLESRVIEQEGTIRHTLTMLIDWIERDEAHSVAA